MSNTYSISVVVISWNQAEILAKCLESLCRGFDFQQDEIIVIDNGSVDNTGTLVSTRFSEVRYHRLVTNIGVGPARNRGILASSKNYVMTLDNDAYLEGPFSTFRKSIVESFMKNQDLGVMGFRLCYPNGRYQFNGRQFPKIIQPFLSRVSLLRKINYLKEHHALHMREELEHATSGLHEVDYLLGANQIFKRSSLVLIGMYDEGIFYGPEDLELCWRIKNSGCRNMVNMNNTIYHDYQRRSTSSYVFLFKHTIAFFKCWRKIGAGSDSTKRI